MYCKYVYQLLILSRQNKKLKIKYTHQGYEAVVLSTLEVKGSGLSSPCRVSALNQQRDGQYVPLT